MRLALVMMASFVAVAHAGSVFPAATSNRLDNPHRGFMLWGTDFAQGAPANYHTATVFHIYAPWREIETSDQVFDWAGFEAHHLAPITSAYPNATFVIRPVADYPDGPNSGISTYYTGGETNRDYPKFLEQPPLNIPYYDYASCDGDGPGRTPDWNNAAMITQLVQFVQAFAARYDGDPRITAVQLGLLGLWGEWHQSGCDAHAPSNAVKIAVRDAYNTFFTNTPLQTRYPGNPDATGVDFGFHEDYFPSFTAPCIYGFPSCDDTGDWNMDYCYKHVTPPASNNWRVNPISGESPLAAQKKAWTNDTADIVTVLRDYHFSFLGPAGQHEKNNGFAAMGQIHRALGYEYRLVSGTWSDTVYSGEASDVTIVLTNSGSAPGYHPYPAELSLCNSTNGSVVWSARTGFDGRNLWPGPSTSVTSHLIFSNAPAGTYDLRFALLNPRLNFGRGILLQNAGGNSSNRYLLGTITLLPADADADGIPDAWELAHLGATTNAPESDADGDGWTLREEYIAGLNPTSNDLERLDLKSTNGLWEISSNAHPPSGVGYNGRIRSYSLEHASAADQDWALAESVTAATPIIVFTNSSTGYTSAFRVRAELK